MSASTAAPAAETVGPQPPRMTPRVAAGDILAVMGRNLRHWLRQPQLLVFSTVQPVMFVLLFNYVFGGAIGSELEAAGISYIDFLLPGIFIQVTAFGTTQTAVGLAEDLAGGMIDRFRSLPMARSAVLAGRTMADACRSLFVVALITGVGTLIGFRFRGGVLASLGAIAVVVAFGFALAWVFALVGMSVKGAEAAQAAGFVWIFPLVFASSAFVPTQTMPDWLRVFADNQPVTRVVNAVRALTLGNPAGEEVAIALAWIAAIAVVFVPLAVRKYRRT
jgi:ABC-2 type transport system permease protein/oleandomycin transport system permease protein